MVVGRRRSWPAPRTGPGFHSPPSSDGGGYLHDLGKIAVPDEILKKGSNLSPEEWQIMKRHPITGENICKPLEVAPPGAPIIRHHHEHSNGSGYPDSSTGTGDSVAATDFAGGRRIRRFTDGSALQTGAALTNGQLKPCATEARRGLWDENVVAAYFSMLEERRSVA